MSYVIQIDATGERMNEMGEWSELYENAEIHETQEDAEDRFRKQRLNVEYCSILNISGQLL
jgi:hypothetical protein